MVVFLRGKCGYLQMSQRVKQSYFTGTMARKKSKLLNESCAMRPTPVRVHLTHDALLNYRWLLEMSLQNITWDVPEAYCPKVPLFTLAKPIQS